jgi:hypothetical protein
VSSEPGSLSLPKVVAYRPAHRSSCLRGLMGASFLISLMAGCSGPEGPVRNAVAGNVTLDGVPLGLGVVRFIPRDENAGPGASSQVIGGEFQFTDEDGPVIATHRVEIEATDFQGFEIDDEAAFAAKTQETGKSPLALNPVPTVYNSASILTATVTDADDQTFQFDLKSKT